MSIAQLKKRYSEMGGNEKSPIFETGELLEKSILGATIKLYADFERDGDTSYGEDDDCITAQFLYDSVENDEIRKLLCVMNAEDVDPAAYQKHLNLLAEEIWNYVQTADIKEKVTSKGFLLSSLEY